MASTMNAYLLECLFPTGWRRTGEIYWRYSDAVAAANTAMHESAARAVRVLSVHVHPDAVLNIEATPQTADAAMGGELWF